MSIETYRYVIVGGGRAGAWAVRGIRDQDKEGSILLIGTETQLPYNRPPLSKELWFGKKTVEEVFIRDAKYYAKNSVTLALGQTVTSLHRPTASLTTAAGQVYGYEKLLLATGGEPRRLDIPGAHLEGICYYRSLDDYLRIRPLAEAGKTAVVIGGGFIGSEIAAALATNGVAVTMVFPEEYPAPRVFPRELGMAVRSLYEAKHVRVLSGDTPVAFERADAGFVTKTGNGEALTSDLVIVGIGISPGTALAEQAELEVGNGIVVDEQLQTADRDIYAAGDVASFLAAPSGARTRVEHWDNASAQGRLAGGNMAGAEAKYDHIPSFFSDLFDFGYEAVGEVDSRLETFADWVEENRTGVIYYLREGRVCGVMTCGIYEKLDAARALILGGEVEDREALRGAIR
jgi:3-phenylpropionate/trans-cinnamate dioxygenase ferredoxin reductase component